MPKILQKEMVPRLIPCPHLSKIACPHLSKTTSFKKKKKKKHTSSQTPTKGQQSTVLYLWFSRMRSSLENAMQLKLSLGGTILDCRQEPQYILHCCVDISVLRLLCILNVMLEKGFSPSFSFVMLIFYIQVEKIVLLPWGSIQVYLLPITQE